MKPSTNYLNFIITILVSFIIYSSFSQQSNQVINTTPNGLMDNIFDQYGRRFRLSDIKIEANKNLPNNTISTTDITPLCVAGYFNLYFESGSGMEIVSNTTQNNINTNRRSVICQVFQDLSQFIVSDNLTNNGNKVNIWVRNINNVIISPNSTNGVLGYGSSYYNVPFNNSTTFGGIADGEVWKTIHTGQDSFNGLFSPLVSNGSATPTSFYHGVIAINFNTNNTPAINWFTTPLTSNATHLNYDLYTEVLRQAAHLLGFTSLINSNGQSKFGAGFNYYSRYDLFLKNNSNIQPLIKNNINECSFMYNYNFNSNLSTSILTPSPTSFCSNTTICSNALKYGNNAVPVYTPNCFDRYSLSHFEDLCTTPPNVNDGYFVVCNAPSNNGTGTNPINTKRFLKPEERNVLIDLGYSVKNVYGNTAQKSYFFYGGVNQTPSHPAAKNLGIFSNGEYLFWGTNTIDINLNAILQNQFYATGFECLQDIYDPTATINGVNNLSILNATTPNQTLTFQSNVQGLHLLRFVPVRNQGNLIIRGNISYIYVYVAGSPANACDIINNGNFEASTNCGAGMNGNPSWSILAFTPDILRRNCTANNNVLNIGTNTMNSIPASDTYNGFPNDNFSGLYTTPFGTEALQTNLSTPLIAGNQYVLSFWAKVNNGFTQAQTPNLPIYFSSYQNQLAYNPLLITNFQNFVPNSIQIGQPTNVPNDNAWHYYTIPFTQPVGTPNHNMLAIYLGNVNGYMFIDDVFILPKTQFDAFNLPNTICINSSIPNLATFYNPNPQTNGFLTFSGNGVTLNGGVYSFTPSSVGSYIINYSYTFQGCTTNYYDIIQVVSTPFITPTFDPIPILCQGSTPPVQPTTSLNGIAGTWSPATISTTASGNYTFTPNPGQCASPINRAVQVLLNTAFVNNADTFTVTLGGTLTTPINTLSVLFNDTYNNGPIPSIINGIPYSIVLVGTPPTIPSGGITFNATTGVFTILPNTTPGTYEYQYYIQNNCYNTTTRRVRIIVNQLSAATRTQFAFCYSPTNSLTSTSSSGQNTNLFQGTTINGVTANATNATIELVNYFTGLPPASLPAGISQLTAAGTFTVAQNTLPGNIDFFYRICSGGTCSNMISANITISPTIYPNDDYVTAGNNGSIPPSFNILSNDQYRGDCSNTGFVPATLSNVTITSVTNALPSYSINQNTGQISFVTPINSGTYILFYTLCDNLYPSLCVTRRVIITVPANRIGNLTENPFELSKTIINPNPTSNFTTIEFNNSTNNRLVLNVFDLLGRHLLQKHIQMDSINYDLDLSKYSNGQYLVNIINNDTNEILNKIVIKK